MKFHITPDPFQKLALLEEATELGATHFEPAGGEPLSEKKTPEKKGLETKALEKEASGARAPKPLPCISDV